MEMAVVDATFYIAVVFLFLWATIVTGIKASTKVNNIQSFAISRHYFGTFALTCTITASFVGGGLVIGTAEKAYSFGIAHAIAIMGFGLQLFLTAVLIAPRMEKFRDCISVGDMLERYYGKAAKVLAGVTWLLFCTGIIVAQTTAIGRVFSIFLNWDPRINAMLGVGIVTFYSYFGGIRSVVATDVLQFIIIVIILPISIYFGLKTVGGWGEVVNRVPENHFEVFSHLSVAEFFCMFIAFVIGDALIPPVIQRLLMASDTKTAQKSMFYSFLIVFFLCITSALFGLIGYAINPSIEAVNLMPYYFNNALPLLFKGFAISALIAVIMSTADSYLNSASIAFAHDIIKPLVKKPLSEKHELIVAKRITIFIGCAAILFNFAFTDITHILLATYGFWGPTLLAVVTGLLFDRIIPVWGLYSCYIIGYSSKMLWHLSPCSKTISPLIFGILISTLCFATIYLKAGKKITHNK